MSSLHLPAPHHHVAATGAPPTMSSREIADICRARHNDVVETIERLFDTGVLRESRKTTRPHQPQGGGRPTAVYDLTKRDTLVVVSGYSPDVRARIIDRWMELENGAPRLPANYAAALRELAEAVEKIDVQASLIDAMAPKVDAFQRIADTDGLILISNAAKDLQIDVKVLFTWLKSNRWIFRRGGSKRYIGFADKLRAGYVKHKFDEVPMPDGSVVQKERVFLTHKGIAKLAVIFGCEVGKPPP